jgi:hypothetical protein
MIKRSLLLALGFGLLSSAVQAAQIIFTFTGSVLSSQSSEYEVGDSITTTFIVTENVATSFAPSGASYEWIEEDLTDPELFTTVTISGASGTWTRPDQSSSAPETIIGLYQGIATATSNDLIFEAAADIADDPNARNGLTIGGEPVYYVLLQGFMDPGMFSFDVDPVNLVDYFSSYVGSYAISAYDSSPSVIRLVNGDEISLALNTFTISIPEPTSAVIFLGGLMIPIFRRKRI